MRGAHGFGVRGLATCGLLGVGLVAVAVVALAALAVPAAGAAPDPCAQAPVAAYDDRAAIPDVHRPGVDCVTYQAVMAGSDAEGGRRFDPLAPVSRGQMATLLVNVIVAGAHDRQLSDGGTDRFADSADSVHRRNINILADAGITRGSQTALFRPDDPVSRQQMASFVVATLDAVAPGRLEDDGEARFDDVAADNVHKQAVEAGADTGLFRGVSDARFAPGTLVSRAQVATFGATLLGRSAADDMLEPWEGFGRTVVTINRGAGGDLRVPAYDAANPSARSQGLMGRDSLRADAGMVFRFPDDHRGGFWMKDTTIPLSIAFFAADGRILAMRDMDPCEAEPCPTYDPGVPYRGALEVNQGFFAEHDVVLGDVVELAAALPPAS